MKLNKLGERRAIELIAHELATRKTENHARSSDELKLAIGIGDDCAALQSGDSYLLITTDMLVGRTDIPDVMTPYQIGWYIVAINFSDIAAKGGAPLYFLISMALPGNYDEEFLMEFSNGMKDCASLFDAQIIGGDTNEGEELVLSGTALGLVDKKHFMARKGARVGDIVAVTGELGSAGAGFHACKNNLNYKKSLRALMQPTPRVNEGIALSKTNAATGSMDISDGLAISLHQLSEANNVGFEIEWEKIPISEETKEICEKTGVSPEELALYFGGDYEVLVTIKPDKFTMAQRTIEISGGGTKLTAIGLVTEAQKGILLAYPNDKRKKIGNRGYEHFTKH